MSKDSSAKYYQKANRGLKKKPIERYQDVFEDGKKK